MNKCWCKLTIPLHDITHTHRKKPESYHMGIDDESDREIGTLIVDDTYFLRNLVSAKLPVRHTIFPVETVIS